MHITVLQIIQWFSLQVSVKILRLANQIRFQGILQPPLYHPEYPDGFNYGAIGMIIGHEITHGFDDQGRHMGANGNMNNWWGEVTASNFAERTKCMENQYSQLEYAGMKLNGKLTLGENIADNGGIKIAYQAWVCI